MNRATNTLAIVAIICGLMNVAEAQSSEQTRSVSVASFASKRPAEGKGGKPVSGGGAVAAPSKKPGEYHLVGIMKASPVPNPKIKSLSAKPKGTPEAVETTDIGVTIWRLRPSIAGESSHKLPVMTATGIEKWTPERVGTETEFSAGDRVRFAIESTSAGYLYVFDSETHSAGGDGRPCMIFPAKPDDDNHVLPGLLVDFPGQDEELPYFKIDPKKQNYTGEKLTVVVSARPLGNLGLHDIEGCNTPYALNAISEGSTVEVYSREEVNDGVYTETEAASVCGARTRDLVREKTADKPCGEKTRPLTRDDPVPQSIYRVRSPRGQPAVATFQLKVRNSLM